MYNLETRLIMLHVDQTKFYSKELNTRGNCLSACVASILNMDIESVVDLSQCLTASEQIKLLDDWLKPFGLTLDIECKGSQFNEYRIANGPASRGCHHSVVYFNEDLIHDPHLSREGLLDVTHYYHIVKDMPIPCLVEKNN